ncbi:dTMP kinase [Actinobacteria bacterium YIM 96077]|uniref:Thymidylate kinase n=2 Tax=Phytoactinopolyspora halophila TaxID=1981511 RepID=A0A329R007_9ACTN|nr:dTMP kinase [Actinobacteria bacterium YIM 96077]RAW17847.1 dTMP kinase [Phytoactinopolyspora halophila]
MSERSEERAGRGRFIAFEGGDGVGKSTQVRLLADYLRGKQHEVVVTHEPGDSRIGAQVRSVVLDGGELDARAEALLFAADRADHVASVISPALARGASVLTDRYVDSSIAYQGVGRALGVSSVAALSEFATEGLRPDLTVLLDLDPAQRRLRLEQLGQFDRIEREPDEIHDQIRRAFLELAGAAPERYLVLDASRAADELAVDIAAAVEELVASGRMSGE